MSGTQDVVMAAGVESMSRVPMLLSTEIGGCAYGTITLAAIRHLRGCRDAERVRRHGGRALGPRARVPRLLALRSHWLADQARSSGRFVHENAAVETRDWIVYADERSTSTPRPGGGALTCRLHARRHHDGGNSSQISDGAAALLVASRRAVERHGLLPRGRIVSLALGGSDPLLMLTAPVLATRRALVVAGLKGDEIDVFEVNEAFASLLGMWLSDIVAPLEKVNVNSGAVALGAIRSAPSGSGCCSPRCTSSRRVSNAKRWS